MVRFGRCVYDWRGPLHVCREFRTIVSHQVLCHSRVACVKAVGCFCDVLFYDFIATFSMGRLRPRYDYFNFFYMSRLLMGTSGDTWRPNAFCNDVAVKMLGMAEGAMGEGGG